MIGENQLMKKKFLAACVMLLGILAVTINVQAADDNIGFNIRMIKAENQINDSSFFDLRVLPKQEQTIYVQVNNTSTEKGNYSININQAYTNKQGFIDYSDSKEAEKVAAPIKVNDILNYDKKITLEPNTSKNVPIKIKMPEKKFDGEVLAGIQVSKDLEKSEKAQISNQYGYILGLRLTETDNAVQRKLELKKVKPSHEFGKPAVIASLKNPTMDAYGHLKYKIDIIDKSTKKSVLKKDYDSDMQIAPNSTYNLAIEMNEKELNAGNYTLNLTVTDAKENKWQFKKDFEITNIDIKDINDATISQDNQGTNYLWIIVILILILLIIAALIWIILLKKKKKEDE